MNKNLSSLKKMKTLVLMGGISAEREISLVTGKEVYNSLKSQGFNVSKMDFRPSLVKQIIANKPDFVFIALHGKLGEDGKIQALLDLMGIPYTGSGVLSSAMCLDKIATKNVLLANKIPTPRFWKFEKGEMEEGILSVIKKQLPLVVKPASQGSAIGVTIASSLVELKKSFKEAFALDDVIMIEKYIHGTEISVGVVGKKVLPAVEIIPKHKFYDYESKYKPSMSEHIIPARINERLKHLVSSYALKVFKHMGCKAFARIDMIIGRNNIPYILEVNTIPGMTKRSLLPDAARAIGMNFDQLVIEIIKQSL
ncbi:MAG: D-alanine--D-alanine ligase [bacterium]